MKDSANGITKWIEIQHNASSLFNVIVNGNFKATNVERETWQSLISGSYALLQPHCNKKGFNIQNANENRAESHVRIGMVANNEKNCDTCDSFTGFGASFDRSSITCGRFLWKKWQWWDEQIAAFGYILVQ